VKELRPEADAFELSAGGEPSAAVNWIAGPLLAFDLETTGVDPNTARPVSYAFVTYENGIVVDTVYRLVNPGVPIPTEATAIHQITDEMVHDSGIPLDDAIAMCCAQLCDASTAGIPVVGMVLRYDLTVVATLDQSFGHCGLQPPHWGGPALDVSVIDRRLDKYRKGRRTLSDLCTEYGVEVGEARMHNAATDATLSVRVLQQLANRYPVLTRTDLKTLTLRQAELHRSNLVDLNEYRLQRGQPPISEWEIDAP
jgi:DNA polymerase-3 subunit epsilon